MGPRELVLWGGGPVLGVNSEVWFVYMLALALAVCPSRVDVQIVIFLPWVLMAKVPVKSKKEDCPQICRVHLWCLLLSPEDSCPPPTSPWNQ